MQLKIDLQNNNLFKEVIQFEVRFDQIRKIVIHMEEQLHEILIVYLNVDVVHVNKKFREKLVLYLRIQKALDLQIMLHLEI